MSQNVKLYKTKNYRMFKKMDGNRDEDLKHVRKIVKSINEKNCLIDYPILITKDNFIIDGQHRLLAAEKSGVDIFYKYAIISNKSDISKLNSILLKWKGIDYLNYYISNNNIEYIKLKKFMTGYNIDSPGMAVRILAVNKKTTISVHTLKDGGGQVGSFSKGKYTYPLDDENGRNFMDLISKYAEHFEYAKSRSFIIAMIKLQRNQSFENERLLSKMKLKNAPLRKCGLFEEYIAMLRDVYNFMSREEARVWIS